MSDDPDAWRRTCAAEGGVLVGTAYGWHCLPQGGRAVSFEAERVPGGWVVRDGPGMGTYREQAMPVISMNPGDVKGEAFQREMRAWAETVEMSQDRHRCGVCGSDGTWDDDESVDQQDRHPTPTTAAVDPTLERKQARRKYRLEQEARSYERGYRYGVQVGKQVAREQMMREQADSVSVSEQARQ